MQRLAVSVLWPPLQGWAPDWLMAEMKQRHLAFSDCERRASIEIDTAAGGFSGRCLDLAERAPLPQCRLPVILIQMCVRVGNEDMISEKDNLESPRHHSLISFSARSFCCPSTLGGDRIGTGTGTVCKFRVLPRSGFLFEKVFLGFPVVLSSGRWRDSRFLGHMRFGWSSDSRAWDGCCLAAQAVKVAVNWMEVEWSMDGLGLGESSSRAG